MSKQKVYTQSFETARENGEVELFHKSEAVNRECAAAIDHAISASHYSEYHYKIESAVRNVLDKFGAERVSWVLAGVLQRGEHDGRYSRENKAWSQTFPIPKDGIGATLSSHQILIDSFVDKTRQHIAQWENEMLQNKRCAQAIRKTIRETVNGKEHLQKSSDAVLSEFGLERVKQVLAKTVLLYRSDPYIDAKNVEWAKAVPAIEMDGRTLQMNDSRYMLNAFADNVRETETLLYDIANHIIEHGREQTPSGNYIFSFGSASGGILPPDRVDALKTVLTEILDTSDAVSDVELTDDSCFDVNFHLAYTPNYEPFPKEIEEHGENWPAQEPLQPLRPAESKNAERPSLLNRLQDSKESVARNNNVESKQQGHETGKTANKLKSKIKEARE